MIITVVPKLRQNIYKHSSSPSLYSKILNKNTRTNSPVWLILYVLFYVI